MQLNLAGWLSAAFVCVVVLILALRPLAHHLGLVDRPGGRKQHQGEIPLIGGLAIALGFAGSAVLISGMGVATLWFLLCMSILVIDGTLDDRYDVKPRFRFISQILATALMIFGAGVTVHDLGQLLPGIDLSLGVLATPFTILIVLHRGERFNMFDGSDGVAGGQAVIACAFMAAAAIAAGGAPQLPLIAALAGCVLGFLSFNWPSRRMRGVRIFMGDAGSTMLGFVLAWFAIELSQGPARVMSPAAALWIFSLPVFDLFSSMARRIVQGRSPLSADDGHLHHVLLRAGLSSRAVAQLILLASAVLAACGLAADFAKLPGIYVLIGWLLLGIAYHVVFGTGLIEKRRGVPLRIARGLPYV
jgi:UDP-GlcNAc:undecaprenyl-phosphate/decaprenyl-phosphate GlcNAc-1-phosphate transferase